MSDINFKATVNYKSEEIFIIAKLHGEHVKQVAYSTYHNAMTLICFTCRYIYSSMPEEDFI